MSHESIREASEHFLKHETAFHLGDMLTEQSHPKTRRLSQTVAENTLRGIEMLLRVDDDIPPVTRKILDSESFQKLRDDVLETLRDGKRIFFSGCGATGRLAILLDAAHRRFCDECGDILPERRPFFAQMAERTFSVMTGGDFALIRSVESFEDFIIFGKRQMQDAGIASGDTLVAVSEGGETSSVIGTVLASLEAGAKTHFVYNNPTELMCRLVERSRLVMSDPRVNTLSLATGPMAVAGSTRMQATTIEMLVIGLAFESALTRYLEETLSAHESRTIGLESFSDKEGPARFETLLSQIRRRKNLETLAALTDLECSIYAASGLVTYFPDGYTLDIFTDTTERSPTFKIPPFRSTFETESPIPWAFVKDPMRNTEAAWHRLLRREPCCIEWTQRDYLDMGAPNRLIDSPPKIDRSILKTYVIGCETDESRFSASPNKAIAFLAGEEHAHLSSKSGWLGSFFKATEKFDGLAAIIIGPNRPSASSVERMDEIYFIDVDLPDSPLKLFTHLAIKLALNNVSTATMGKLGRLNGNWMAHVDATNKKLIDRSIRLVSELTASDYASACYALFESLEEMDHWPESRRKTVSPAAYTVEKIIRQSITKTPEKLPVGR